MMSGAGSSSAGGGGKRRHRDDDDDGSDASEQSAGSGRRGRGGRRGAPGNLPSFLQLGDKAAVQGRASRSRSRESSASRSSSRSRSPGVDSAAPIPRGALPTQDIYGMVFEVARNFGEHTTEDLEPMACIDATTACERASPPETVRRSMSAVRSLAERSSQLTAHRSACRRNCPTCRILSGVSHVRREVPASGGGDF